MRQSLATDPLTEPATKKLPAPPLGVPDPAPEPEFPTDPRSITAPAMSNSTEDNDPKVQAKLLVLTLERGVNPGVDGQFQPKIAYEEAKARLESFRRSPSVVQLRPDAALKADDFVQKGFVCLDNMRKFADTSGEERTKNRDLAFGAWRELERVRIALCESLE